MAAFALTVPIGRYVRPRLCPRVGGVCLEVDLSPDCRCQFDCVYCSVNRHQREIQAEVEVPRMVAELSARLAAAEAGACEADPIRHVVVGGNGEPTVSPQFSEAIETILHLRALRQFPFFRVVLMTNGVALHEPAVARAVGLLCHEDEIWIKLDAGSAAWMELVNRPESPVFERVLDNVLNLGRRRLIVVQSLFPQLAGKGVPALDVETYARVLERLAKEGAQISLVQIYSAALPTAEPGCGHLPLRTLSEIARQVRQITGLKVEVF